MKRFFIGICASILTAAFCVTAIAQGDVRSATGLPIPIGEPVIWGQVELRGLRPDERRPNVVLTLFSGGAQVGSAQCDDRGFYVFRRIKAPDGGVLQLTVGGIDVGRQMISPGAGDRFDMAIDWSGSARPAGPGVISAKGLYANRSEANEKLFDQASAAAKGKDKSNAIKLFNEIVTSDPQDFVAWTELGSLYFAQEKHDEAVAAYEKAIALKPDFIVALMNLGKVHMGDKSYPLAVAVFEKAVVANPKSADAYQYLGEAYLQNKQGSKAVVVLNEAIRLAPVEKAEIHLRLATLYNAANLKDRAVNEYKLFLQKKPDYTEKAKLEKYIKDNSQ
jgi:Flp pilus assembly protein TadD